MSIRRTRLINYREFQRLPYNYVYQSFILNKVINNLMICGLKESIEIKIEILAQSIKNKKINFSLQSLLTWIICYNLQSIDILMIKRGVNEYKIPTPINITEQIKKSCRTFIYITQTKKKIKKENTLEKRIELKNFNYQFLIDLINNNNSVLANKKQKNNQIIWKSGRNLLRHRWRWW